MNRIAIPVSHVEFDEGGNTLWVHNAQGATVLRIKVLHHRIRVESDCTNVCSHADIVTDPGHDLVICLADDACDPLDLP